MMKNWRTAKVAVVATVTALALGGGTAAADAGGTVPASPPVHGWHHPWLDHRVAPEGTFGTVTSVNGVSTAGTCGTADSSGAFTVTAWKSSVDTVDVGATTTYVDPAVTSASFADVCVADTVGATGTVADDTVTAAKVFLLPVRTPPAPHGAFGTVASVNGVTTAGTCGTADSSGVFTVTAGKDAVDTVDVTDTTTFVDPTTPPASFADVCVGDPVAATGTVADDTVTAAKVFILTPCLSTSPGPAGPVAPAPRPATTAVVTSLASRNALVYGTPSADPTTGFGSHVGDGKGAPRIPGPGASPPTDHGSGWPAGGPFGGGEPDSQGRGPGGPALSGWSGPARGRP